MALLALFGANVTGPRHIGQHHYRTAHVLAREAGGQQADCPGRQGRYSSPSRGEPSSSVDCGNHHEVLVFRLVNRALDPDS
jgi:hypothetical protein